MGSSGHRKLHGSLGRPPEAAGHPPCPGEKLGYWAGEMGQMQMGPSQATSP